MTPKLYFSPGACSLAVHIVLEEIGAPYSLERVSVPDGATQSPAFTALNPKGRVPVLVVGDTVLTEAPAILSCLALSHPPSRLLPTDPEPLARCLEWFNWLSGTVHAVAFAQIWRPQRFVADHALVNPVTTQGRDNVLEAFAMIEAKLRDRRWAVADRYSCVAPFLLVFYRWGNRIGLDMRDRYPAWTAHAGAVGARPAVQAALSQEGITVW
jgi:glutathione S-transferase